MDNTLKMILGVLGVSALLVLLIPTTPAPVAKTETAPAVAAPPPPPTTEVPPEEAADDDTIEDENGSDLIKFGEPMMDGNPIIPVAGNDVAANGGGQPNYIPQMPNQPNIPGFGGQASDAAPAMPDISSGNMPGSSLPPPVPPPSSSLQGQ